MSADDGRQPGPSSKCGLGGTGQSTDLTDRVKRLINMARQSTTVQQLEKVMKKGIERLMEEIGDLEKIKTLLTSSLADLDEEIGKMLIMKDLAEEAVKFQHGVDLSSASEFQEAQLAQIMANAPVGWSLFGDSDIDDGLFSFEEDIQNSGDPVDSKEEAGNLGNSDTDNVIKHNESGGGSMTFKEGN